jgi:hypothetical protein
MTHSFHEPTSFNGADLRDDLGRTNGQPVPYRCTQCDWHRKGSLARAEHWQQTGHTVVPANDPRFRKAVR